MVCTAVVDGMDGIARWWMVPCYMFSRPWLAICPYCGHTLDMKTVSVALFHQDPSSYMLKIRPSLRTLAVLRKVTGVVASKPALGFDLCMCLEVP